MSPKQQNLDNIRHSLAHLLAAAVLSLRPDAKLGIGPTIQNGFYYDFQFPKEGLGEDDLPRLEKEMKKMIKEGWIFSGKKVTPAEAKKQFGNQPFKLDLIKEFTKEKKQLTIYSTCPPTVRGQELSAKCFMDLCRGGHVKNASEIDPDAFKLTHVAGAYWRGDEKNPMLTRIYGVAFDTKKELDDHLKMTAEAEKRDHRKLGKELDLFLFSDLVGPGLPLWTPKGTLLRHLLDDYVWELRKKHGYQKIEIPHITKKELYEISGHWEKFKDELFKMKSREGHIFVLKPMNCPHHVQIFARKQWSYREMPQRYANTTICYRDEQTGELHGISRTRAFTQDDAHVFCRQSQIKEEMNHVWDIIDEFYSSFGFKLEIKLSLHDPKNSKGYLGKQEDWEVAENMIREIAKERGVNAEEQIGEAAFYGPKIDFIAKDSLGREWQVGTNQLDMNLPERFGLTYINEKGNPEKVYMIHAAIMGSIERFMSIMIEHYAGAFPVWLSPVQAVILPISQNYKKYGEEIISTIKEKDIRVEMPEADETLGKRIRSAELQKIPYILIVGEKEEKKKTINVRKRHKKETVDMTLKKFLEKITKEINQKM